MLLCWLEAQTNAPQACPKTPFHPSPLSPLYKPFTPLHHHLSSSFIPLHPYIPMGGEVPPLQEGTL